MATYDGYTFEERGQQAGAINPQHGAAAQVQPRLTAGGVRSVSNAGSVIVPFDLPIRCGSATLVNLMNDVGASKNLVYSGGTVRAFLAEVKNAVEVRAEKNTYFATLGFLTYSTSDVTIQSTSIDVVIDGSPAASALLEATISHGVEQSSGQATLAFTSLPTGATEGVDASVEINSGPQFAGTVTGRAWDHWPLGVAIDCRDRMEYLTYPYGGTERSYTNTTLGSVWQNLGEAQGIASANMSIEDPGWTVAITEPLIFRRGDRFLPWMKESMSLAGYCIFTKGSDSAIYVRPYDENVTDSASHTLTEGVNILSARRNITRDGIYNGIQVDGLTFLGASVSVYMATANSDVRDPPGTVAGPPINSNLIETDTRASVVAATFLDHNNFKPESYTFTLPGTAIEPMDMLVVTHADLELTGATVTATQVEHRWGTGGYVTTVQAKRVTR